MMSSRPIRKFYPPPVKTEPRTGLGPPIPCSGCGYDLRGSPDTCPECGKPVMQTLAQLRGDGLRLINHGIRRWTALGCLSILAALVFFVVLWVQFYHPDPQMRLQGEAWYRDEVYWTELVVGLVLVAIGVGCVAHALVALDRQQRALQA